jgi:hypothetical protein
MLSPLVLGSDASCPMMVGVKMYDFWGVKDEECHNRQEGSYAVNL